MRRSLLRIKGSVLKLRLSFRANRRLFFNTYVVFWIDMLRRHDSQWDRDFPLQQKLITSRFSNRSVIFLLVF